jgi:two-component system LytT family response regulator
MESSAIKIIVVDDEAKSRETIIKVLELSSFDIEVIAEASSVTGAIEAINKNSFDLLFLDINLGNEIAFDIFSQLVKVDFEVIFVTAYNKYAVEAFKVSALDYLLKPFSIEALEGAIQKFLLKEKRINLELRLQSFITNSEKEKQFHKLALPVLSGFDFMEVNEILYCQADGNYTRIYLKKKEKPIVISKQIGFLEQTLASYGFIRPHNSFLTNLNYVESFVKANGGSLRLFNGVEIPIARNRKEEIKSLLGI